MAVIELYFGAIILSTDKYIYTYKTGQKRVEHDIFVSIIKVPSLDYLV